MCIQCWDVLVFLGEKTPWGEERNKTWKDSLLDNLNFGSVVHLHFPGKMATPPPFSFIRIVNKISVWSLTMLWWQKLSKNYSWTFDICKLLEAPWSQCFSSKTHTKSKLILWLGIFSHTIDNYSNSTAMAVVVDSWIFFF
jgi:hypothetical protein